MKSKQERILASITDAGAKRIAKKYNLPVSQIEQAFNVYDNCVESGDEPKMSLTALGELLQECVTDSQVIEDAYENRIFWMALANEFRNDYYKLCRKVWK